MSAITIHPPGTPLQHTGPVGRVMGVGGYPTTRRRSTAAPMQTRSDVYWPQRRRSELLEQRRAHPDAVVVGRAVPYNTPLPGGRDDWLTFTPSTEWLTDDSVPLKVEHSGYLGHADATSEADGLHIIGTVLGSRRRAVGDRHRLSPRLTLLETRGHGSVLEVTAARLHEVSVVRSAAWQGLTDCVVYQKPTA